MSDKHTPVPWVKDFGGTLGHIKSIAGCGTLGDGVRKTPTVAKYYVDELVLSHDEQEANARFIVKACNHHAELVEALRDCSDELAEAIEGKYHGILGYPSTDRDYRTDMAVVERARTIIAKLETNQ